MSHVTTLSVAGTSEPCVSSWQVLVIAADRALASRFERGIKNKPGLQVAGTVARGADAVQLLRRRRVDLVLLDLRVAGGRGIELIDSLRTANPSVEVIVVSWARSAESIRAVLHRGVLDYLVAPVSLERFHEALEHFVDRASALSDGVFDQSAMDRLRRLGIRERELPRGLTAAGIRRVRSVLGNNDGPMSSAQVADETGLARVSARRYLEHLVATDLAVAEAEMCSAGRGRPRKLYRLLAW